MNPNLNQLLELMSKIANLASTDQTFLGVEQRAIFLNTDLTVVPQPMLIVLCNLMLRSTSFFYH